MNIAIISNNCVTPVTVLIHATLKDYYFFHRALLQRLDGKLYLKRMNKIYINWLYNQIKITNAFLIISPIFHFSVK